jgi:hypothetical protein
MDHREIGCGGIDWINLAEDKDQCRALVNDNGTSVSIKREILE